MRRRGRIRYPRSNISVSHPDMAWMCHVLVSLICNFIATISCSALSQEPWSLWSQGEDVVVEEQEE